MIACGKTGVNQWNIDGFGETEHFHEEISVAIYHVSAVQRTVYSQCICGTDAEAHDSGWTGLWRRGFNRRKPAK